MRQNTIQIVFIFITGLASLFNQLTYAQTFLLGSTEVVPIPGVPVYTFTPDGHLSFLYDSTRFQMYWPGQASYRTVGTSMTAMGSSGSAILTAGLPGSFDNGGAWLFSVFRLSGSNLIGFYHAEDHEFSCDTSSHFTAWKSIALCTSTDDGATWQKKGQIIRSSTTKPCAPTWGGNGDDCVIWDAANRRWVCFYQESRICMAVSYDSSASPGTWFKYYNGSFSQLGIGGQNTPIPALKNHGGGNPSVHFNTFLQKWVMVWHTWDGQSPSPRSIWLSTSLNLVDWTTPVLVLAASTNQQLWYPTIIGDSSDVRAGESSWLCYAYFSDITNSQRQFLRRRIQFSGPTNVNVEKFKSNIFELRQNYPNPFNPSTIIDYKLSTSGFVSLKVCDELGREAQVLVAEYQNAGDHSIAVNLSNLSGGLYFCRLQEGSFVGTKKLVLLK